MNVWDAYLEHDPVPLRGKYCVFLEESLEIILVELPTSLIHEFFSNQILLQLRDKCKCVSGLGSSTLGHNQPDQLIRLSDDTPGFSGLPANTTWLNYSTLIIEVGMSQRWTGISGLDAKAKIWFDKFYNHGLEYILCVKVRRTHGQSEEFSYKLYDVPSLVSEGFQIPDKVSFPRGSVAIVSLDSRRVLGIPQNSALPPGVADQFAIDLSYIRDRAIAQSL
jgi:hypothetical protein